MSAVRQAFKQAFPENVRSKRYGEITNRLQLDFEVGQFRFKVLNISESGAALLGPAGLSHDEILSFRCMSGEHILESGTCRLAWSRPSDDGLTMYGIAFASGHLREGFIEALDQFASLGAQVDESISLHARLDHQFIVLTQKVKAFLTTSKKHLDELEEKISIYSLGTKQAYERALELQFEPAFIERLKAFSRELDKYLSNVTDKTQRKVCVEYFRGEVGHFYTDSAFIGRANRKPQGYAGDYEMMNQIYRNSYEGGSMFSKLMHKYGINEHSSLSVRYRKNYLIDKIKSLSATKDRFISGSLACGPAREIVDFLHQVDPSESSKYSFILMDQDLDALLNAKRNISDVVLARGLKCELIFAPLSVRSVLEQTEEAQFLSSVKFDFLYTAGLYDYLTQPVAKALSMTLFESVKPGGMFIVGNFHPDNPTKTISELVADWRLVHRGDEQMLDLVPDHLVATKNLHFDDQKIDVFLETIKPL